MNPDKMTSKSLEALEIAQKKAVAYGHTEVDLEHFIQSLLEQENGVVPRLFEKMDLSVEAFLKALESEIEKKPRVSGPGREAGKVYITNRLSQIFVKAEEYAKRLKDDYVSVEHLLLGALE